MPERPNRLARPTGPRPDARPWKGRLYGRRWKAASKAFLDARPLCECDGCRAAGRVTAAEVVDHVVPHRGDEALFWDGSNWRPMAKRCHDRKTGRGQ